MCGIAGLYTKTDALRSQLGERLAEMLEQLSFRGPDSAGVAFYRDPAPAGACKVSLHAQADPDWAAVGVGLAPPCGEASPPRVRSSHATFIVDAEPEAVQAWLAHHHPELRLM